MSPSPIIFYADDDSDDRTWVKEFILKKEPLSDVKEFEDGAQLLSFLRATDILPNLIILDINMPVMSGKEVLSELRKDKRWYHLKVVMFTNSGADIDRQFASSLDAHFITKPMSIDGIRAVTERFLALSFQG